MLNKKVIDADFCVVGGGLAGICAAIAAARNGARVVLMHERPRAGRKRLIGNQNVDMQPAAKITAKRELLKKLHSKTTIGIRQNYYIWDTVLYDFVIREKNITLLLNCTCMDAETQNGDFGFGRSIKISSITGYQMTTQTLYEVHAKNYADCSGDSILAPLTGAEFRIGRESAEEFGEDTHVKKHDNLTMGNSCLIQGRETERPIKFTPPSWSTPLKREDFMHRGPDIHNEYENFWYLELGGNRDTIADAEDIARELIPLAVGTWDYIKIRGNSTPITGSLTFSASCAARIAEWSANILFTEKDITSNRQLRIRLPTELAP